MTTADAGAGCPHGHANPAGQAFCGTCGARLTAQPPPPGPPTFLPPEPAVPSLTHQPPGSQRKLVIGAAVAVLVLGVGAAFVLGDVGDSSGRSDGAAKSAATTTTKPKPTTTTTPPHETLTGELVVVQDETRKVVEDGGKVTADNPVCSGADGYDDLGIGTSVTVRNQSGDIIATGAVDKSEWVMLSDTHIDGFEGTPGVPGIPAQDYGSGITTPAYPAIPGLPPTPGSTYTSGSCKLTFAVPDVPAEDFYTVELAHRGEVPFSHAKLDEQERHVVLTLT